MGGITWKLLRRVRANIYLVGNVTQRYRATPGSIEFFLSCGGMSTRMCNDTLAAVGAVRALGYHAHFLNVSAGGNAQGNRTRIGCVGHPSFISHREMAAIGEPVIRKAMGWEGQMHGQLKP